MLFSSEQSEGTYGIYTYYTKQHFQVSTSQIKPNPICPKMKFKLNFIRKFIYITPIK